MAFADIFFGSLLSLVLIIFIVYQFYKARMSDKELEPIIKKNLVIIAEPQFTEGHILAYEQRTVQAKNNRLISWLYPYKVTEEFLKNPRLIPYVVGQHRREMFWQDPNPLGTDTYIYLPKDESTIHPQIRNSVMGNTIAKITADKLRDDYETRFYVDKTQYAMDSIRAMKGNEARDIYVASATESLTEFNKLFGNVVNQPKPAEPTKPKPTT